MLGHYGCLLNFGSIICQMTYILHNQLIFKQMMTIKDPSETFWTQAQVKKDIKSYFHWYSIPLHLPYLMEKKDENFNRMVNFQHFLTDVLQNHATEDNSSDNKQCHNLTCLVDSIEPLFRILSRDSNFSLELFSIHIVHGAKEESTAQYLVFLQE